MKKEIFLFSIVFLLELAACSKADEQIQRQQQEESTIEENAVEAEADSAINSNNFEEIAGKEEDWTQIDLSNIPFEALELNSDFSSCDFLMKINYFNDLAAANVYYDGTIDLDKKKACFKLKSKAFSEALDGEYCYDFSNGTMSLTLPDETVQNEVNNLPVFDVYELIEQSKTIENAQKISSGKYVVTLDDEKIDLIKSTIDDKNLIPADKLLVTIDAGYVISIEYNFQIIENIQKENETSTVIRNGMMYVEMSHYAQ